MSSEEIIRKMTAVLDAGIESEIQVVYVLVAIRKLLERDGRQNEFRALTFHCDWAVHAHLDRAGAHRLLRHFDSLRGRIDSGNIPEALQRDIDDITQMRGFRQELERFLPQYHLPPLAPQGAEGWTRFLNLYARVIADIPLIVKADRADEYPNVERVVVKFDQDAAGDSTASFRVSWMVHSRSGSQDGFYVIHKYDANADEPQGMFLRNA